MLERTSTTYAPWTVIEANNKLHAHQVLTTVRAAMKKGLVGPSNSCEGQRNDNKLQG